jgi:hypothetical protein
VFHPYYPHDEVVEEMGVRVPRAVTNNTQWDGQVPVGVPRWRPHGRLGHGKPNRRGVLARRRHGRALP